MYEAKIILDSINPSKQRCITAAITYPRIVHAEVMTHRDRERNAGSSRAIPWTTMKRMVTEDPFIPLVWGKEQTGMQTGGPVHPAHAELAERLWSAHRNLSLEIGDMIHNIGSTYANLLAGHAPTCDFLRRLGISVTPVAGIDPTERVHKALPNRLTEAHQFITVVMTATDWKNFFALRCHPQAEIHFQKIAYMLETAIKTSEPRALRLGEWHLPFVTDDDDTVCAIEQHSASNYTQLAKKISVARCARVSYLTHEGKRDILKDIELYARLRNPEGPPHASPMGHVAMAAGPKTRSGPFRGFVQHREEIPGECAD